MWVVADKKHRKDFFRVKSIPCMLTNVNFLLNYPVVSLFILIDMVPLNVQFHLINYISKSLLLLTIFKNMRNFHATFYEISMANGYSTFFDCPDFYGGVTKCTMLRN